MKKIVLATMLLTTQTYANPATPAMLKTVEKYSVYVMACLAVVCGYYAITCANANM